MHGVLYIIAITQGSIASAVESTAGQTRLVNERSRVERIVNSAHLFTDSHYTRTSSIVIAERRRRDACPVHWLHVAHIYSVIISVVSLPLLRATSSRGGQHHPVF